MGQNPNLEEIDPEIRGLVKLLNSFPYIQTTSSCSGHYLWDSLVSEIVPRIGEGDYPFVSYDALNSEAYNLTQKIIEGVNEISINRKPVLEDSVLIVCIPVGYLSGDNSISLSLTFNYKFNVTPTRPTSSKYNIMDFPPNERKEAVLQFLNDVESVLKEYIK